VLATAVWLSERPLAMMYRGVPFQAISESTADDLVDRGIPRERVVVIPPGVSSDYYTPDATQRAAVPTFAYLGRLKKYKGVDQVIRAFARVTAPGAVLEIAGAGDYRPALERLIASLDLADRVRFLGFITEEEKLALLRRAWAVALASPKEGWGLTNVEAEACGTPVVASNIPGDPRVGAAWRDGVPRPAWRCRRDGRGHEPPRGRSRPSSPRWGPTRGASPPHSPGTAARARPRRICSWSSTPRLRGPHDDPHRRRAPRADA